MADNYCSWSEVFELSNDAERQWCKERLDRLREQWDEVFSEEEVQDLVSHGYDENSNSLSFEYRLDDNPGTGTHVLWVYSEEYGNIENAVAFLQELLRHFNRRDTLSITWADTCSRPRAGEFGGGGVVFNANEARWLSTSLWVEREAEHLSNKWSDDKLQFARLLCELVANWDGPEVTRTLNAVADSMDLTVGEINKLFDRAEKVWADAKEIRRG